MNLLSVFLALTPSGTVLASSPSERALPSLQEETKRIHVVLLSEPTENDGGPTKQDQFSATIKIAKAILPVLNQDQKLVFVGSPESFARLTKNISDPKLLSINAKPYMWLQDLVEFGNSESGLMSFVSYGNSSMLETVKAIMKFANSGTKDPYIKILKSSAIHGTTGGNIEKWPGDIGVMGSSDFQSSASLTEFARQIFPKETLLELPTSWLTIGHLDEVIKPLRYRSGDNCEIEFLINSPNAALTLLSENKAERFLDELESGESRAEQIGSIKELCRLGNFKCSNLKNVSISRFLARRSELRSTSDLIQKSQEDMKSLVTKTYEKYLPKCRLKWIATPAIYISKIEGEHLKLRSGRSIFPSLTNGVLINETYLVADPGNPSFRRSFSESLSKLGIKTVYVPLGKELFHGEVFDGHIHCMTQLIREK